MAPRNRLLLAAGVVLAAGFAPVPPPRTGVAEAVVNSFGGGPTGVRQALLASVPHLLQGDRVKRLACLKGEADPAGWLGKRLRADEVAPRGPVRLRLDGCRPSEALALLAALMQAYEDSRRVRRLESLEELLVLQGQAAHINLNELNLSTAAQGPAVLQRPELVGSGTSR